MKEIFENIVEFIDEKNNIIIKIGLTILGIILVGLCIVFSADNFSVSGETNRLVTYIEQRDYSQAIDYYNKINEEFSSTKMNRLSKSLSKKVNKILANYGDKYIKGEIGKDYFISLLNIINELDTIHIDVDNIIDQAKRVNDLYLQEKISYETAMGYIQSVSTLKISKNEIYVYEKKIDVIEDSRKIYALGVENQEKKMYKEAMKNYDKVLIEDKKNYDLAQDKKEECIEEMYDHYIEKANMENENGNFQKALEYIDYLKQYYIDDEFLNELSTKYEKNLELYTLTNDEILTLISKKGNLDRNKLKVNVFQQMIQSNKYYYVEVFTNNEKIDELLIDPRNQNVYSYLDEQKSYNNKYSDGYWRVSKEGQVEFAISKNSAESTLQKKLDEIGESYKYLTIENKQKALNYVKDKDVLNEFLSKKNDIYYYAVVNRGFFKRKEIYMIDPYTKDIFKVNEDKVSILK